MSGNIPLSILLTAHGDQARRELAATSQAAKELGAAGGAVGAQWSGASAQITRSATAATASVAPLSQDMDRLAASTRGSVGQTANLAAQFNDIAVMAAYQNPLQLALQQGTQINQEFTRMGGHREGVKGIGAAFASMANPMALATIGVIAFGTMGVQWLMSLRTEAVSVEDALAGLKTAVDDLSSASRLASPRGIEELERRYGRVTVAVQQLVDAEDRAARRRAENQLRTTQEAQAAMFGRGVDDGFGGTDTSDAILTLHNRLGILRSEAAAAFAEVSRIGDIRSPAELADVYGGLIEMIERAEAANGALNEEQRTYLEGLLEARAAALQLAAIEENRGQWDNARAQDMLAELDIQRAINAGGEDSRRVAELRIDAERATFEQSLRTLDVSEAQKVALRAAWEAANSLAAVDIASGIARARQQASEMADELVRAGDAARGLSQSGSDALADARIRAEYSDPAEQAYQLALTRMHRTQAPIRESGYTDVTTLQNLDAEAEAYANNAAEVARLTEAQAELARNRRDGTRTTTQQRAAVVELIAGQTEELAILRETDPVQREMLRHREVLASATAAERAQIEALITERLREADVLDTVQRQQEAVRDTGHDIIRGIAEDLRDGASAGDILANVLDKIADRLLDMGTTGIGDLLFGASGSNSGGLLSGLFGALFGVRKNALGDVVGAATLFAYGDKPGQLGVMGEAGPEAIMPLTHAGGTGVGAIMDGRETTLGLTRLSSGKLGVMIPPGVQGGSGVMPFASGSAFGYVPSPPAQAISQQAASGGGQSGQIMGQIVISPSRDFEARWTGKMQGIAVQITQAGLEQYDRGLPARVDQIAADPALKG